MEKALLGLEIWLAAATACRLELMGKKSIRFLNNYEVVALKRHTMCIIALSLAKKWECDEKQAFNNLFLWFRLYLLHGSFTAHWNTCWLTSTRLINNQDKPTFFTFVLRPLLCHPPSPPQLLPHKNLVLPLDIKLFGKRFVAPRKTSQAL
jgi:hypothetical protein